MITKFKIFENRKAEMHTMKWWDEVNSDIADRLKKMSEDEIMKNLKQLIDNKLTKDNAFEFLRNDGFNPPEFLTLSLIQLKKIKPDVYKKIKEYEEIKHPKLKPTVKTITRRRAPAKKTTTTRKTTTKKSK
jgi:hypothetical protein